MVKLIGALASLFLGSYLSNAKPPSVMVMDYLASKSRILLFMIIACITLSTLLTAGVVLSILGGSAWYTSTTDEAIAYGQMLFSSGVGLILFSGVLMSIGFAKSKSMLEVSRPEQNAQPEHPIQAVLLSLIKEFAAEKEQEVKQ